MKTSGRCWTLPGRCGMPWARKNLSKPDRGIGLRSAPKNPERLSERNSMRLVHYSSILLAVCASVALAAPKKAAKPARKPVAKPPASHQVKGQKQIVGGDGQFGVVYSLKNGVNLEILSARYTLEPFVAYSPVTAET